MFRIGKLGSLRDGRKPVTCYIFPGMSPWTKDYLKNNPVSPERPFGRILGVPILKYWKVHDDLIKNVLSYWSTHALVEIRIGIFQHTKLSDC